MRFTLHDVFHESAGVPDPAGRPRITDAMRARVVGAIHRRLEGVSADGGTFVVALDAEPAGLRMLVTRHGTALAATWVHGSDDRIVAAGALLAGSDVGDDAAALGGLQDHSPALPFGENDYDSAAAAARPCLATMYLDADWFNKGRVELAFTALALAALLGPDGTLTVREAGDAATGAAPQPAPPQRADVRRRETRFDLTRERLCLIAEMAMKKTRAAMDSVPGTHFRVYPPEEVVNRPGVLRVPGVFDLLRDTAWWVKWHDARYDRLGFGEFLAFIDQLVQIETAMGAEASEPATLARGRLNGSVWPRPQSDDTRERQPLRVKPVVDTRGLIEDPNVARLLGAVTLEMVSDVRSGQPASAGGTRRAAHAR